MYRGYRQLEAADVQVSHPLYQVQQGSEPLEPPSYCYEWIQFEITNLFSAVPVFAMGTRWFLCLEDICLRPFHAASGGMNLICWRLRCVRGEVVRTSNISISNRRKVYFRGFRGLRTLHYFLYGRLYLFSE